MGARLIWQRRTAFRRRRDPAHVHTHHHDHVHTHDHCDGHVHSHLPPAEGFRLGSVVAVGIMIVAVGLNRMLLVLGLIVSFSVGLAAMLIAIGILLVRSRSLVERAGGLGGRFSTGLPLGSAVIVTVLGLGMTLSGLASYLG